MKVTFCNTSINYKKYKDEINNYLSDILNSGVYIEGDIVNKFEKNFAEYIGMKHCIGVGNGTDALEIAIASLNLPENSEIIVQGNTYIATGLAVVRNNHKLILADLQQNSINIDINNMIKLITPNTKVIIIVHMYGIPIDIDPIIDICKKYNIILIEDCAQAHGAMYNNKKIGSFGDISCFSFYPTKNLGACGDGGCIMTNSDDINTWIRQYKNFGSVSKNIHNMIGRNSRLDTIQAGILDIKLKYLDNDNNLRKENAQIYYDLLKNNKNIVIPHTYSENNVYHLFIILVKDRDKLMKYLKQHNIETSIHYPSALCDMDIFKDINKTPNCCELSKHILSLPMYPGLTYEEIKYVCDYITPGSLVFDIGSNNSRLEIINIPEKHGNLNYMNIYFDCKRIFYIDMITQVPAVRGNHAIINFNEILIIISGSILLKLIDMNNNIIFNDILTKNDTFHINRNTWVIYTILEINTVIMVMCDMDYNHSIIENDINKFLTSP